MWAGVPQAAAGGGILLQTRQDFLLPATGTLGIPEGGGSVDLTARVGTPGLREQ